jgi:hypothetical protein
MNARAPLVATWLARRFLHGPRWESFIGDLLEQHLEGKSRAWYWRQVILGIVAAAAEDLSAHKVLALRGLLLGMSLYFVLSFPVTWLSRPAQAWIAERITCGPDAFWCQFWSNQLSAELLVYLACIASGWIVARAHAALGIPLTCLFAGSVLLLEYGSILWMFVRYPVPPAAPATTVLIVSLASVLGRPLAVMVGGVLASGETAAPIRSH